MNLLSRIVAKLTSWKSADGDHCVIQALKALDRDDAPAAIAKLEEALDAGLRSYDEAEIRTILGKAYKDVGRYEDAIAMHREALEIRPRYHKAWNNLGIAHLDSGDVEEALRCFKRSIAYEPTYAYAHASLGAAHIELGQPEAAVRALEKATELMPSIGVAHGNLAVAYAMTGRFQDAHATLRRAIGLGYENWRRVSERIRNLEAFEHMSAPVHRADGRMTADRVVEDPRAMLLPPRCPNCGAPVNVKTVHWSGKLTGHCPYCGINLVRPGTD